MSLLDYLDMDDLQQNNQDTNWTIMISLINLLVSIANIMHLYYSIDLEDEPLDAHKIISYLLGYRYIVISI